VVAWYCGFPAGLELPNMVASAHADVRGWAGLNDPCRCVCVCGGGTWTTVPDVLLHCLGTDWSIL
jgi:hypothetical protein